MLDINIGINKGGEEKRVSVAFLSCSVLHIISVLPPAILIYNTSEKEKFYNQCVMFKAVEDEINLSEKDGTTSGKNRTRIFEWEMLIELTVVQNC